MKDLYFPHFQPIISLNNGKIFAYEALARTKKNNQIVSASEIFHSKKYSMAQVIEIDRHIRASKKAEIFLKFIYFPNEISRLDML